MTTVHDFRHLGAQATYDTTQTGRVAHGDVLLLKDGIGVMERAWPVAVVGDCFGIHDLLPDLTWDRVMQDEDAAQVPGGDLQRYRTALQEGLTVAWALACDGYACLRNTEERYDEEYGL